MLELIPLQSKPHLKTPVAGKLPGGEESGGAGLVEHEPMCAQVGKKTKGTWLGSALV